jgi:N-acetyl-D-muramate 6-phosphate phosphatase
MALDLSRIRALCFDVDGTLSDTDDLWVHKFERLLKPLRVLFPDGNSTPFARKAMMTIETPGNLMYHWLDRLHLDDEVAGLFSLIARSGVGRSPQNFWLVPGIAEMLAQLEGKYPMAVVSARGEKSTLSFLDQFGLRDYFSDITTAQTCRYTKPFPDPVRHAAQQMGMEPEECLMIGDTTVDMRAGKAAGAQTVGVLCGFGEEGELLRAGADLILPTTADLTEILLEG